MIIMPRFFVDQQPQDGVLTLTGENAHHAGRVLRLRVGEGVTLCDGAGMDFDCTVEAVEKEAVTCRVVSCHAADTEPKQSITLFMAVVPVAQAIAQAAESKTALFFYENERRTGLHDALAGGVRDTVSLMVGPEGGFDPAEARAAVGAGLQSVSLGTRILRCETAPIAALAAVLYAGGNM